VGVGPRIKDVAIYPLIHKEKHIILFLITLLCAILIFSSIFYYRSQVTSIKQQKYAELKAIAGLKISEIMEWRSERLSDVEFFSSNQLFRQTKNLVANNNLISLLEFFRATLSPLQQNHHYENIFIVSPQNKLLFSLDERMKESEQNGVPDLDSAVSTKKIIFSDFHFTYESKTVHLDIIAPSVDNDNSPVAVLIFTINPNDYLYRLIQKWPLPSKFSETLIVGKEGNNVLFLNELRHTNNTVLNLRIPLTSVHVPAVQAVLGYKGIFEGIDYRGVDVLSDIYPIPNTPWFMITKIDKSEIYADLYFREIAIIISTLLLLSVLTVGLIWLMHFRQRNVYLQLYSKERELSESHEEFKTTLYSIGDGVITTDVNGNVKQMNHVAQNLTGWTESEAQGKPIMGVFKIVNEETKQAIQNPVEIILREGKIVSLTNHSLLISKEGFEIPVADSSAPIKNKDGNTTGVVLVFREQIKERAASKLINARLSLIDFSCSYSLSEFLQKTLDEITALVDSPIGFYHFVESDQKTLSLQAWSTKTKNNFCEAEGQGLHYDIEEAGV